MFDAFASQLGNAGTALGGLAGGALGTVSDALSAPRRAIWSALGAPEHGNQLVAQMLGMDPDSFASHALGLGAEVLGDPLTYAGGLLGRLGGSALGAAANLGRGSEAAAAATSGAKLAGALAEGGSASPLASLLNARRGFSLANGVTPAGDVANVVGRSAENARGWMQAVDELAANHGGAQGFYLPAANAGAIADTAGANVARHEAIHGMIDQAAKSGNTAGLPALMQAPATLRQGLAPGATGPRAALADMLDELAAHTLENRTTAGQLGGAANFLFETPWNAGRRGMYQQQFAGASPALANLYRYGVGYSPYAALAAGGAGGAAAAGLGGS